MAIAIVSTIVLGHPFNKSRLLIGSNRILLCLNNSSQIAKRIHIVKVRISLRVKLRVKSGIDCVKLILCQWDTKDLRTCVAQSVADIKTHKLGHSKTATVASVVNNRTYEVKAVLASCILSVSNSFHLISCNAKYTVSTTLFTKLTIYFISTNSYEAGRAIYRKVTTFILIWGQKFIHYTGSTVEAHNF